ncbi:hypothetical protein [Kitasatospora cineracea]|uniref:hypothetical protein n=1 Tax=Kitasatospora cineracea TaxID=88074 RepID=UPI003796CE2D
MAFGRKKNSNSGSGGQNSAGQPESPTDPTTLRDIAQNHAADGRDSHEDGYSAHDSITTANRFNQRAADFERKGR